MISLLSKKSELSTKIKEIEAQLEDFENFFEQFGADNQTNLASKLVESENEIKWHNYNCLSEQMAALDLDIADIKTYLEEVDEQAREEKCFCL